MCFKLSGITELSQLQPGARVYLIGICGVAMAQLAVELSSRGYRVAGSDENFYEPMGSFLRDKPIELLKGFSAENLSADLDLVVIGNRCSADHPEVRRVSELSLAYTCFPRALAELVIGQKRSVVFAGTHGKSTSTAMAIKIFSEAQLHPSFFVGAKMPGLKTSLVADRGPVSVVEGDEYDDVFFSKQAKFMHYRPTTFVLNALEFDHADLYDDLKAVVNAFHAGIELLPEDGVLIVNSDYAESEKLGREFRAKGKFRVLSFGIKAEADYQIVSREVKGSEQLVTVKSSLEGGFEFNLPASGQYNALNALAAIVACKENGVSLTQCISGISKFQSVSRRQEVKIETTELVLIEDFAHHPTAVRLTLEAVRESYPERIIWGIFEPRSNTSRLKVFEKLYLSSFSAADRVVLAKPLRREIDGASELLDVSELAAKLPHPKEFVTALTGPEAIRDFVVSRLTGNDLLLVMSNGSFGGLVELFKQELAV